MARDDLAAVVDREVQYWPGAGVRIEQGGRHRRAVLSHDGVERFVTISTTPTCPRSRQNTVRDVRQTLRSLGAERVVTLPIKNRRQEQQDMGDTDTARSAVNSQSIVLTIPAGSDIYDRFADKKGNGTGFWTFELRANVDPKGFPYFAVVRCVDPPAGKKHKGIAKGSFNKVNGAWSISISNSVLPVVARLGPVTSSPITLREDLGDVLVFNVPEEAGAQFLQASGRPEPAAPPSDLPEAPPVEEPAPKPPAAAERQPVYLQLPKEKISLERAVAIVNRYKDTMGDDLRMHISEGGFLACTAKFGIRR